MRRDLKLERIKQLQCFSACSDQDISLLGRLAEEVSAVPGAVVSDARQPQFVVVRSGVLTVQRDGEVCAVLSAGDHFGDVEMLVPDAGRVVIVAETAVQALTFGRREFLGLVNASAAFRGLVLGGLARRAHAAEEAPRPARRTLSLVGPRLALGESDPA